MNTYVPIFRGLDVRGGRKLRTDTHTYTHTGQLKKNKKMKILPWFYTMSARRKENMRDKISYSIQIKNRCEDDDHKKIVKPRSLYRHE